MRLTHYGKVVCIEGRYDIHAQMEGFNEIHDSYALKIVIDEKYPREIPSVFETAGWLPRDLEYHIYSNGSFCLGSEIRLKAMLSETPSIPEFAERILDPFLYSVSYKLKYNRFPNGELAHGEAGLIDDYERMFNVTGKDSVLKVLSALGKKKRVANKLPCPCGCGKKLGNCEFRFSLEKWRRLDRRRFFREHLSKLLTLH